MIVPMDTILTITPSSCGYVSYTYVVLGQAVAIQASTLGITISDSYPFVMTINTAYGPGTYPMYWYAIPEGNACQTPILKTWTLQIICALSSVSVASGSLEDTYTTNIAGDE